MALKLVKTLKTLKTVVNIAKQCIQYSTWAFLDHICHLSQYFTLKSYDVKFNVFLHFQVFFAMFSTIFYQPGGNLLLNVVTANYFIESFLPVDYVNNI